MCPQNNQEPVLLESKAQLLDLVKIDFADLLV